MLFFLKVRDCLLFTACIFFLHVQTVFGTLPEHDIHLYHDEEFAVEQEKFFPFDTIYTVIDFKNLESGDYLVNIDWVQPNGKLARSSSYQFSLTEKIEKYRVYFWLKLHAKGPMGQLFSGSEYPSSAYGSWKVQVFCNGEGLSGKSFKVTEDNI